MYITRLKHDEYYTQSYSVYEAEFNHCSVNVRVHVCDLFIVRYVCTSSVYVKDSPGLITPTEVA